MDNELKEKLLNLTLHEILQLTQNLTSVQMSPGRRFTLGKLDASVTPIMNAKGNVVLEYRIDMPQGPLCHIVKWEDVEKFIKELNLLIAKYQK